MNAEPGILNQRIGRVDDEGRQMTPPSAMPTSAALTVRIEMIDETARGASHCSPTAGWSRPS